MSGSLPIKPREIFMTLPQKDKQYEYPRDVQTEVWDKWFEVRNNKNNVIKMNTGSGKTVVGLMILQSCLNEGNGPAVYVVPDNFLASQVCNAAKKLGISAVTDRDDYLYTEKRAILVMPIQALVNARSVFGMRRYGNYPIGSVLMDDVHACFDRISTQYSIKIPNTHDLYREIIALFDESWKAYDNNSYEKIVTIQDPLRSMLIPFWMWQGKSDDVYKLLAQYENDDETNHCVFFHLALLADCFKACNCVITANSIEITPYGIPISEIQSFENAKRRIFMSATLSDDSVFSSAIGLHESDIPTIITPNSANDIGDRLILFPRHLNNQITDEQIKAKVLSISERYNVVIIVPSTERAKFWDSTGNRTVTKETIISAVDQLKSTYLGHVVFVSRYDGIDLPDNACRLLVIDGLPPLRTGYDTYVQSIDPSNDTLLREQVQRVEQGMGRGVRSNSDSCCIVLMGDKLADVLLRNNGISYFSSATFEQYKLSRDLWNLLKAEKSSPSLDEIFELADYSLNREVDWIQNSKERLASVTYANSPSFDLVTLALRKAFDFAVTMQYQKAIGEIDKAINSSISNSTKGYLLQVKASYTNFIDSSKSQQVLLSGRKLNASILTPITGIQYDKAINAKEQAKAVCDYASMYDGNQNDFLIYVNTVLSDLNFSPDADKFEQALKITGEILGFVSTRPDKETGGAGPDNLWAIGNSKYFVIECKSAAVCDTISKDYCNQLGGSGRWFEDEYGTGYTYTPIMVHKSEIVDDLATKVPKMRVITASCLDKFKANISAFTVAFSQGENWKNESNVTSLLASYRLRSQDIESEYTIAVKENS